MTLNITVLQSGVFVTAWFYMFAMTTVFIFVPN